MCVGRWMCVRSDVGVISVGGMMWVCEERGAILVIEGGYMVVGG